MVRYFHRQANEFSRAERRVKIELVSESFLRAVVNDFFSILDIFIQLVKIFVAQSISSKYSQNSMLIFKQLC